ncbi:MAG: hypothetical protein C6P35_17630 [Cohnella sp.]|nr:MAG: hypothetical protein C6P35_17630 [Cohnella sp.]
MTRPADRKGGSRLTGCPFRSRPFSIGAQVTSSQLQRLPIAGQATVCANELQIGESIAFQAIRV